MTLVIGLTGSIGTGKSMIAAHFNTLQIPVIDADVVAREVVEPGRIAYKKIVDTFGMSILYEDKTLNRTALGQIVFKNEKKRKVLNEIIHPEIRKEMLKQKEQLIKRNVPCIVMDIPLLFEGKLTHFVDKIIVVTVKEHVQLERIVARDESTKGEAQQRINAQMPVAEKEKMADAVIDNNGTITFSQEQLENILIEWNILK